MIIDEMLQAQKRVQMLLFTPAANLIKEYGWGRDTEGEDIVPRYSLIGAMCEVQGFRMDVDNIGNLEKMVDSVGPLLVVRCNIIAEPVIRYCTWRDISDWNDDEARTKEQVLHVLNRTTPWNPEYKEPQYEGISQDAAHGVRL